MPISVRELDGGRSQLAERAEKNHMRGFLQEWLLGVTVEYREEAARIHVSRLAPSSSVPVAPPPSLKLSQPIVRKIR